MLRLSRAYHFLHLLLFSHFAFAFVVFLTISQDYVLVYFGFIGAAFRLSDKVLYCEPYGSERVWAISIARLNTLLHVHLQPIYVIVFDGPCVEILS